MTVKSDESTWSGLLTPKESTFCSVTTSRLYSSDVCPKYSVPMRSSAGGSLAVSVKAALGNATVTYGSVSVGHGTCTYFGPVGGGSFGTGGGAEPPLFQAPQCFSTMAITWSGTTSPATITVVYSGRYHR